MNPEDLLFEELTLMESLSETVTKTETIIKIKQYSLTNKTCTSKKVPVKNESVVKRFSLSKPFSGSDFYELYKEAIFLKDSDTVKGILGWDVQQWIKREIRPDETFTIEDVNIKEGNPVYIKKADENTKLENYEFTYRRLTGLIAAYVYENRSFYPNLEIHEAKELGLKWSSGKRVKQSRLYLSAVFGTEHHFNQFLHYPLICRLRKVFLGQLKVENVKKEANMRNNDGKTMLELLEERKESSINIWLMFPNAKREELLSVMEKIKKVNNKQPIGVAHLH